MNKEDAADEDDAEEEKGTPYKKKRTKAKKMKNLWKRRTRK